MLARKLPRSVPALSHLTRSFTTSSISLSRSPALGDVKPGGADEYNGKQKEFRDKLEAAKQRKEQADRQLIHPNPSTASSNSASILSETASVGLGSLSIAQTGEARQAETEASTSSRRKGPLSNLIYGTPEGRQMDKDMERSFSEVLARGKYVHSIVFHQVKPDKVDQYVELVGKWYPKMANMPENRVNLVGSWRTEVGDADTFGEFLNSAMESATNRCSPHLGIPTLHRLSRLTAFHPASS